MANRRAGSGKSARIVSHVDLVAKMMGIAAEADMVSNENGIALLVSPIAGRYGIAGSDFAEFSRGCNCLLLDRSAASTRHRGTMIRFIRWFCVGRIFNG